MSRLLDDNKFLGSPKQPNRVAQFCFHPTPAQRIYWGYIQLTLAVLNAIDIELVVPNGHPIIVCWCFFCVLVCGLSSWVNFKIYNEWKEKH